MANIIRVDMAVTVTDLQTDSVLWEGDVPAHLSEHYSTMEAAEWATQWVDAAYGLSVAQDDTEEDIQWFGILGYSLSVLYRAGARYLINVTGVAKGKGFTVTDRHGDKATFLSDSEAEQFGRYTVGAILGTTEVTL